MEKDGGESVMIEKEFGRHIRGAPEDGPAYWLTQETVLGAMPDRWISTAELTKMLTGREDRRNGVRRVLNRLKAKGLVEQRRADHGTGVEWRPTGGSLRLLPCPVCGQEPTVVKDRGGVMAMCWCTARIAEDMDALRHGWNDLYCAADPATEEGRP